MQRVNFNFNWARTFGRPLPWETGKNARIVNLPDDFVLNLERKPDAPGGSRVGYAGDGFAVYTKKFDVPEEWYGKQVLLNLDGAYMCAEVTLNKEQIGMHPYGYTPYTMDITKWLRSDMVNTLMISTQSMQPSSRWYSGAGLYRSVEIWLGEPCYLDPRDLFITTPEVSAENALVHVEAEITNSTDMQRDAEIHVCIGDKEVSQKENLKPGKTRVVLELSMENPLLWDDITPNLYDVRIAVSAEGQESDITETKIGIRKIEVDAVNGLRINGRKLKLHGGCVHHDNGMLGACAYPDAEERKMQNLKAAGFNAIRTAHNPPSAALLDACDRLGILVIDEFFDCWRIGKNQNDYHQWFADWWKRDIEYTMRRDRNHPSVYCWSFGNEIQEAMSGHSDAVYWTKAQADFIRTIDSTRLVTNGGMFLPKHMTCDGFPGGPGGPPTVADPYMTEELQEACWREMVDCLDIVSLNYSFRNYEQFHKLFPDKALQGTETQGIDAWGNREAVYNNDHVIGDFMWTAHDNLGEAGAGRAYWEPEREFRGLLAGWPWLSCFQGDLALDGERLPRSYYRKVIWGMDEGIYLFVKHPCHAGQQVLGTGFHWNDVKASWTYPEEYIGKPIDVEAYADCDVVEFYVNDELKATVKPKDMIAYATVNYEPGCIRAVSYKDGEECGENIIQTTGCGERIVLKTEKDVLKADGMSLCYVSVTLVDSMGQRIMDADCELNVSVYGAAELAGLGSNNPCTTENYGNHRRMTWNGRAMLVLRAGLETGVSEITVTADGYPAASVTLSVI